jgi:type I restriction enzyme M protein
MTNPTALVQKLWNYCNILRDDGLSYGDLASQARHELVSQNHDVRFAHCGRGAVN